jgi:lipopolysaccharide/colanic/teichoic acid biosynthesis glycosyltransferase
MLYTPLHRRTSAIRNSAEHSLRRALGCGVALAVAPFLALLGLGILVANICARDFGPLLYSDIRYGKCRKPFRMWKFRSLAHGSGGGDPVCEGDRRVTPIGSYLRRTRIDELPQLINVLFGHMDLYGPRPVSETAARRLGSDILDRYASRFEMRPGLYGPRHSSNELGGPAASPLEYEELMCAIFELEAICLKERRLGLEIKVIRRIVCAPFTRRRPRTTDQP